MVNFLTLLNVIIVAVNALLLTACIKVYTEVVKYKIFKSKDKVV